MVFRILTRISMGMDWSTPATVGVIRAIPVIRVQLAPRGHKAQLDLTAHPPHNLFLQQALRPTYPSSFRLVHCSRSAVLIC